MQSKYFMRIVAIGISVLLLDRFVCCFACSADTPSPSSQSLHFERDVRPILKAHCFRCHGEDGVVEADIDLRQVRLMRQSGAIDSTDPRSSLLLEQIRTGTMPKGGKPLDSKSIETIEKWIEQGALTAKEEPGRNRYEIPSCLSPVTCSPVWVAGPLELLGIRRGVWCSVKNCRIRTMEWFTRSNPGEIQPIAGVFSSKL